MKHTRNTNYFKNFILPEKENMVAIKYNIKDNASMNQVLDPDPDSAL